jgi:murein DD-endopeptidase MepM/ murein hydrolase activator NlpD
MRRVAYLRSLPCTRFALVAAIVFAAAGCSSDADRLRGSQPPGSRPSADLTGSTATAAVPAPAPAINSAPLPPPPSAEPAPVAAPLAPPPTSRTAAGGLAAPAKPPAVPSADNLRKHRIVSGDTLSKIARRHGVSVAELAAANKMSRQTKLRVGNQLVVPVRTGGTASPPPQKLAGIPAAGATNSARKITPAPQKPAESKNNAAASTLSFRWPVRGRIISGFGPKPGGQENAGINVAVPEGTPVKAAEDGVVVYANNELKTYGNLLLIRHANGFVTAYAHLGEILVKRDETVKRGQVVAKSGRTGDVASPQLHFEIRRKSTAVDPMPYLDRAASL